MHCGLPRKPATRSGVERQLEIIGEALRCLHREDRSTAATLEGYRHFMAFRNALAHEYRVVDSYLAWETVQTRLPHLTEQVTALIAEGEQSRE